jgi:16S rRNA (cytosine967-C5)-methyltransferase
LWEGLGRSWRERTTQLTALPLPQGEGESSPPATTRRPAASPRLLVAASLLLEGGALGGIASAFSGGRFAPAPLTPTELATLRRLEGHTLEHRGMPDAVRLEIPDWLFPRLAERFGPALEAELQALLQPAPLDLRANLLKTTRDAAQAALAAEGLDAVPTRFSPWGLRIPSRRPVTNGAAFRSGLVEIQDEGSQLVAALLGARPSHRVCDFCAGAGGKTLALAATMDNRGQIVACDTSAARLANATIRLRRAGASNVERHLLEPGDKWAKRRAETFDRVLVDAPCTGTGTWRRNPDARQRLAATDLAELTARQAAILDAAAPLVRKRGRLVYATCALLEEENEAQVMHFLARHPGFSLVPLARAWPFDGAPPCTGDFLALTPARHGTDGFFAAVLERTA